MSVREITGNLRQRYIQAAALLSLIDRVRGEPTSYGLDHESDSICDPMDRVLKRKFLDAFALICASHKKNSRAISAACFDKEDRLKGTVIRIASNDGVSDVTLASMRDIVRDLSVLTLRAETMSPAQQESEILVKIIRLNIIKVRGYLMELKMSRQQSDDTIVAVQSRLTAALPPMLLDSIEEFLEWFSKISSIPDSVRELKAEELSEWVRWAQQARKAHLLHLRAAFTNEHQVFKKWVSFALKLGRYQVAARTLIKIALEIPSLFQEITVEALTAPPAVPFSVPIGEDPVLAVLKRVPEIKPVEATLKLSRVWDGGNVEDMLRKQCKTSLAAHAELQIVSFYDEHPQLKPESRFIGVSKKSCYLCYNFLAHHHSGFVVSSCHQKMWLSIPPPAKTRKVYLQWKTITTLLCIRMETIIREELTERFGLKRLPVPADSTAGGTIGDITERLSWRAIEQGDHPEIFSEDYEDAGAPLYVNTVIGDLDPGSSFLQCATGSTTPGSESPTITHSTSNPTKPPRNKQSVAISSMMKSIVLHFRLADDHSKQDIILMSSVWDWDADLPSWAKFMELLRQQDGDGLYFRSTDYMMINDSIRVRNERQFRASLQYLVNTGVLNANVSIYSGQGPTSHGEPITYDAVKTLSIFHRRIKFSWACQDQCLRAWREARNDQIIVLKIPLERASCCSRSFKDM